MRFVSAVAAALALALGGLVGASGAAVAADSAAITVWTTTTQGMKVTHSSVELWPVGTGERIDIRRIRADGSTRFTGLAAGDYVVVVATPYGKPSERSAAVSVADGEHAEVTLTLTADQTLSGTLRLSGEPVAGTTVTVLRDNKGKRPGKVIAVKTDASGTWGAILDPGRYLLRVDPVARSPYLRTYSGSVGSWRNATVIEVTAGKHVTHTLDLIATASLTGTLRDHQGRPLVGARLDVTGRFHEATGKAVTDESGSFAVHGLPAGQFVIFAADADGIALTPRTLTKNVRGGSTLDLGDVTVATAQPKGTARITLRLGGAVGDDENPSVVYVKDARGRVLAREVASSGEEYGRSVRLNHLPAGSYRVYIAGTGWSKKVRLAQGQTRALGTVKVPRLRGTTPITGVVRKAGGSAIKGFYVSLCDERKVCFTEQRTNARGRFTFKGIARGKYTVITTPGGPHLATKPRTVQVRSGSTARDLTLTSPRGGTVTGKVKLPAGTSPTTVLVRLVRTNGANYHGGAEHVLADRANAKGVFVVKNVPAGTYRVVARDTQIGGYSDAYPKGATFKKSAKIRVTAGTKVKTPTIRFTGSGRG